MALVNDAVKLCKAIHYCSAGKFSEFIIRETRYVQLTMPIGTVEFIVDDLSFKHFFLEMNTRIQV